MPRIARAVAVGFPHHIVQRGNNKEAVFFEPDDRTAYLSLLKRYSQKWACPVMCYCLMTNHVHLLLRPAEENSLYKMMQGISLCYTQYVNRRYKRSGRLWESRFHSCIIDQERYLWAVARYIEQNPVRARMMERAEEYQYSSARAHLLGQKDDALGEELFPAALRSDYAAFFQTEMADSEMKAIRQSVRTGRPMGDAVFIGNMEKQFDRELEPRPTGRPKAEVNKWDVSLNKERSDDDMAFEKYVRTGRVSADVTIRKNGTISISARAVSKYSLDQYPYAVLYFDPDERKIGVAFMAEKEAGAYSIQKRPSEIVVTGKAFLTHYGIGFGKAAGYESAWDADKRMLVISLGSKKK
jgi:putative transposase